jgi:hypothetical protein
VILIVQFFIAAIVLCPIIAFFVTYVICRKFQLDKYKAIAFAADVTTGILFFSISIAIKGLWEFSVFIPIVVTALVIAILFTYIDWRTKKEIEIKPLLKKIWRVYFIILSVSYFLVWIIGLTHSIIIFMLID